MAFDLRIPTNWVEGIFNHMIRYKEIQVVGLPYWKIIIRLLETFNIDTMDEAEDSTNNRITYTTLQEIKYLVKHGEIQDDPTIKEEEEEEPEETKIDKVLQIFQNLARDMEKIMAIDGDAYCFKLPHLCVLE